MKPILIGLLVMLTGGAASWFLRRRERLAAATGALGVAAGCVAGMIGALRARPGGSAVSLASEWPVPRSSRALATGRLTRLAIAVFSLCLTGTAFAQGAHAETSPDMTHRMMMLVLQLGAILFAAKLGNMAFEKLRLPGVLGELSAGILIGPYLLGGIRIPGFAGLEHGLFYLAPGVAVGATPVSPELYGICALAAVVLLFMVGLETDIKLFMRYSLAGTLVGVGGVIFSFVLGDLTGVLFLPMIMEDAPHDFMSPSCLFLGIISTATSVGITARVLSEKRKLESPEGVTILAGAVIDDVLGIIMLAVGLGTVSAAGSTDGVDWGRIGGIALKAVGMWLIATVIGIAAARHISRLLKLFKDRASIATMALGLALLLAGVFEEARLAMIIGAYVMGLSLSRTDIRDVVRENLASVHHLLVPVFFTVMGMMVNMNLLLSPRVLLFGAVYSLLAIVAKVVGCGLPALACNFNLRGAARVGCGMLPRGEVALIVAGIGLAAGLLSQQVFGVAILMTLVTTIAAPPVLVMMFSSPTSGLRRERLVEAAAPVEFEFPSAETTSLLLTKLRHAFEAEGFFVHALDRGLDIYQLRKDAIAIGLRQTGNRLVFDCAARDTSFVRTAMVEVLAEFETAVRELRKPLDARALVKDAPQTVAEPKHHARFAQYVTPALLRADLRAGTKAEVIDELLDVLGAAGLVGDPAAAREAVLQREQSMSTGMEHGLAIPHGRTDAVNRLVCAVGIKKEGIEFDAMDGQPSRIFVMTLSPRSTPAPHMEFMSLVANTLDEAGREALLGCSSASEMYSVLAGEKRR